MVRRGRRRGDRIRHRRRLRGGQRRGRGGAGTGAGEGGRRGRHQRDGGRPLLSRRRHRSAAGDRPRRQCRRDVQVPGRGLARIRTTRRSAHTATAASSTSTGWRTWVFSSNAVSTRARSSSRPAPRACPTPATRRCGRSASRRSPRRAATRCRCPANSAAPRWSSTCWSNEPTNSASRSAMRPGVTNLVVDDGAVVGVSWKHFTETGAVKAKSVIIAAGGFAMNPEMVAEHTPALGQKRRTKHHGVVEPYILGNPNDDGLGIRLGVSAGRRGREPGPAVHHRRRLPAGDSAHGHHRQQPGTAVRHRRLLSLPHIGLRAGTTRPDRLPHRRRGPHADARDAADQVHRRLGDRRGDGSGARHSRGQSGRNPRPVQRERGARRGSRLPQTAGIHCAPDERTVGGVRPLAGPGDVLRVHHGRTGGVHRRRGAAGATAARFPACTPRAHAPRTSPRTARATPAARSWARARSSVAAQELTRPGPRPARGATRRRRAVPAAGRGAVRAWGDD